MSKAKQIQCADSRLVLKFADDGQPDGTFEGYASAWSKDIEGDRFERGAFAKSLTQRPAKDVRLLWQHRSDTPIGVWETLEEDDYGLRAKGRILTETAKGAEALTLMRAGAVGGLSVGFRYAPGSYNSKERAFIFKEIDLLEISVVSTPAHRGAVFTNVKSASASRLIGALNQASAAFRKEESL